MISTTTEIASLLVVSRDSAVLRSISLMGASNSWQFETSFDAWEAMDKVQSGATPDLLLLDLPQGGTDGLHILHWLRRLRPNLPIILIGHPNDVGRKEESIRMGACDYLIRPIEDRQLEMVIQRSLSTACEVPETDMTSDDVEAVGEDAYFIGISQIMRTLRAQAALLAEANVPVLILGEGGSGKETTARLIHKLSVRSGFEFAKVNCAALPENLLERELFGYERAGTNAPTRTKPGKLELCAKGTIFLEEITEMPLGLQSNLLQVLQNKRFIRPGTSTFIEADVRILAANGAKVERGISEKRFREDLYHHLSAYTIYVPPLRERKEELPFLSRHFMHRLAKHYGLTPRDFSPAIIEAWQAYDWPGNLRELEHFVKRYLMVGDKELAFEKTRSDLETGARNAALTGPRPVVNQFAPSPSQSNGGASGFKSLRSLVQSVKSEAERSAIAVALEKTGWNRKAASRLLNVSYRTVLYKIEQYKMTFSDAPLLPRAKGVRSEEAGLLDNGPAGFSSGGMKSLKDRRQESL
jgi:two-component system response regulator AtoC